AQTTAQLAQAIGAPAGYLAKVMQCLNRAGIVTSQRGLHGGMSLARAPGEISVLEIVRAVDVVRRITDCPLGKLAHASGLCPLHQHMDSVLAEAERAFEHTTISGLLENPQANRFCRFPCLADIPPPTISPAAT
ncbi:MAG: Rrf2 family transcriptional regulator, partial [Pirellulaceae bacterium]